MAYLGVYTGNDPNEVAAFEKWMGRNADGVLAYAGHASWDDLIGSTGWIIQTLKATGRRLNLSIPLIPNGALLSEGAKGAFNVHYQKVARDIATNYPPGGAIIVRTGWEFNGGWFPWTIADGKESDFIGTWRHFVTTLRAGLGGERYLFDWCPNEGQINPEIAYPGDDFVDIIGLDTYHNPQWHKADPLEAFDEAVHHAHGLQWQKDFAAAHQKPLSLAEWGVCMNDFGPFVDKMAEWLTVNSFVYHHYWDSNAAYPGKLSDGQYPTTGQAFRKAFEGTGSTGDIGNGDGIGIIGDAKAGRLNVKLTLDWSHEPHPDKP